MPRSVLERESGAGRAPELGRGRGPGAHRGSSTSRATRSRHARIHTAPQLAGFVTPRSRRGYDAFDQPLVRAGERDLLGAEVPLGTPLLRSAPRTSDAARFFEDEAVRSRCVEIVAESGGEAFFRNPGWERRLRRAFGGRSRRRHWESAESRAQAIASS